MARISAASPRWWGAAWTLACAVLTAVTVVLTVSGGAVAAGGSTGAQLASTHPGVLLPTRVPATVVAHAKTGTHTSTKTAKAAANKPPRQPGAHGIGSTDPSVALDLANAMKVTGSTFVTGATFVTVPATGTPDLVSSSLAPALTAPGFPSDGGTFAVLSTGDANLAGTANLSPSDGTNDTCEVGVDPNCVADVDGGSYGDPNTKGANRQSAHDVSILKVAIAVPKGMNCLSFDYRFLSDEYPEFVGTSYNDALIAELDTNSWAAASSLITAPKNFAFDPAGKVVSINAAGTTSMSAGLSAGTTYDGATPLLRASTPVTVGNHNLFLSIFDQGDHIYDSAAFVDNLNLWNAGTGQCGTGSVVNEPPADLSLTKSAAAEGTQITYTLHVANAGPNPAENVKVEDEIPAGLEIVSASADCLAGAAMECSLGTLASGATADVTLVVNALDNATYANTAEVVSSTFDPIPQNNEDTASITLGTPVKPGSTADLSLVKSGPATAALGETVEYDLTVSNAGPEDVDGSNVTIVDALPDSMVPMYVTYDESMVSVFDGCYLDDSHVVTCYFAEGSTLAAGESFSVGLVVYPVQTGDFENDATAFLDGNDPEPSNDTSGVATTVSEGTATTADLTITKTVDKYLVAPEGTLTYTIKVTNKGPSAATGVETWDYAPYNTTDVSLHDTLDQCTELNLPEDGGGFDCYLNLNSGQSDTITYKVTVSPDAPLGSTISNTASEFPDIVNFDPNPEVWGDTVVSKVGTGTVQAGDLAVDLTTPTSAPSGSTVTTLLKVTNLGPNTVAHTGAFVNLLEPGAAGAEFVSAPGCTPYTGDGGELIGLECVLGSLAKGASKTVTAKWTAPATVGTYEVGGDAYSDDETFFDPDYSNNMQSTAMEVTDASADLALTHTGAPGVLVNGSNVTYTLTATNNGPNQAEGVQLVDTLPGGSDVVSIKGAMCSGIDVISCNLNTIDAGKSVQVTIVAQLNVDVPPLDVEADATVAGATNDPDLSNNADNVVTTVNPPNADLGLVHTVSTSTVLKGGKVVHKFQVRNYGPLATTTSTLGIDLPTGVTFVSATGTKCTGAPSLTCALGKIPVKAVKTVQVTTTASVDAPPDTVDVTAAVSSNLEDLNPDNDETLQTITVNPPYGDLKVTVTATPSPLVAKGGTATFKFAVKNDGPQASTHVTLTATFDDNLTMPTKAPAGCSFAGRDMTCTILSLGKGATKTFSVATKATLNGGVLLTVGASVGSDDVEDPDADDDTCEVSVTTKT